MSKIFKMAFEIAGELDSSFRNSFKGASGLMAETREEIKKLKIEQRSLSKGGSLSKGFYEDQIARHQKQIETLNKVQDRYAAVEKMSDKAAAGRKKYGGAFLKSAAVGALVFGPMINEAMEFESAMADVRKVVDFDTPEQYKQMQEDIVKLSQSIPMTAEGLAAIVAAGGQAGIEREGLVAFAEDAAKMGVAFDISADQAGDMMAKWRTAFKMNQEEVRALADQVNFLSDSTAATAPQISGIISRIGPLGEVAGISSNQLAALGATLASMGIQEEVAATGIKNMMLVMNQGEAATKRQRSAFEALGLDATEMAKRMQVDGKAAILDLLNAAKKLPKEQQTSVLTQLFGRESVAAIAPLLNNTEALVANFEKVAHAENYAGSMAKEFASRSATTANAMQLAKNSISGVAITLGSMFLPAIAEGFKTVGDFVNRIASWAQANPETAKTIGTVAAGAIGLTMAVSGLGFAYNVLLGGAASVIKSFISFHTWLTVGTAATNGLTGAQLLQAKATNASAIAQGFYNTALMKGRWLWAYVNIIALNVATTANAVQTKAAAIATTGWNLAVSAGGWAASTAKIIAMGIATTALSGGMKIATMAQWLFNAALTANPIGLVIVGIGALIAIGIALYKNWDEIKGTLADWGIPVQAIEAFCLKVQGFFKPLFDWVSEKWGAIKSGFASLPFIGGNPTGGGTPIAQNAKGGIYPKGEFLTTFAEKSGESAIPHDGSQRAKNLWAQTGEIFGMSPVAGASSFVYQAPQITIQGNADSNTVTQIRQLLEKERRDFKRMFEEMVANKKRVSYS